MCSPRAWSAKQIPGDRLRPAVVLLAAALSLVSCSSPPTTPSSRPNVIVVLIDTLRADHVGWYGKGAGVSPFLDGMAAHGTVFTRAYATSSWTTPSVVSIFTSRFPSQTGIVNFGSVLDPSEQTLAEELQRAGYATAAFTANFLMSGDFGYRQGFDEYRLDHDKAIKVRAGKLCREAEAWLDQTRRDRPGAPVFLFLHVMEPHEPLQPPADVLREVAKRRGADATRLALLEGMARAENKLEMIYTPKDKIDLVRDLYDAEIASLDAELKTFFAALEQRGLLRDAMVIVTADHGEEFYDHGGVGHGHTLYEELIHVPLFVSLPGQTTPGTVDDVVSLVDLAPTVLAGVGLPAPTAFEGKSRLGALEPSGGTRWLGALRGWVGAPETAYSELSAFGASWLRPKLHERALVKGTEKLIERRDGKKEAYDLARDPEEHRPAGLSPAVTSELVTAVAQLHEELASKRSVARTVALDEQTRERMRALGYEAPK